MGSEKNLLQTSKNKWHIYLVKAEDTIQSIATEHNLSWKKLANANHLKAPYTLAAGDEIKVPSKK